MLLFSSQLCNQIGKNNGPQCDKMHPPKKEITTRISKLPPNPIFLKKNKLQYNTFIFVKSDKHIHCNAHSEIRGILQQLTQWANDGSHRNSNHGNRI